MGEWRVQKIFSVVCLVRMSYKYIDPHPFERRVHDAFFTATQSRRLSVACHQSEKTGNARRGEEREREGTACPGEPFPYYAITKAEARLTYNYARKAQARARLSVEGREGKNFRKPLT